MKRTIGVLLLLGFGCSGAGDAAITVCQPVGPGGLLDGQAAGPLMVTPDERYVAFLRDPTIVDAGCIARTATLTMGTLVVLGLQPDGSVCERVVSTAVSAESLFFSSDVRRWAFMNDVDDCGYGKLRSADADGSHVRLLHESVYNPSGVGSAVLFWAKGEEGVLAAPIAGGNTVSLGSSFQENTPVLASNATGTALAYRKYGVSDDGISGDSLVLTALPSGKSQALVDAAREQLGNFVWSTRGNWLAFCHGPGPGSGGGSAEPPATLTLVAADASKRTDVSTTSTCFGVAFSPQDDWLAYEEIDPSGGSRLVTTSLKDRGKVALGALPAGYFRLSFIDGGTRVLALGETAGSSGESVYSATTTVADSLHFAAGVSDYLRDVISAGGYLAVRTDLSEVGVYPLSGGAPVTLAGNNPRFEPGVPRPRLLLDQYEPSGLTIAATDGNGGATFPVPDLFFSTWLGSTVLYGTAPDESRLMSLAALTNAGAVTTSVASEVEAYAWAPLAAPTRLFYSRKSATAGGPPGVFYVDLPR